MLGPSRAVQEQPATSRWSSGVWVACLAIACADPAPPRVGPEPIEEPAASEEVIREDAVPAEVVPQPPIDDGRIAVLVMPEGWRATERRIRSRSYYEAVAAASDAGLVDVLHPRPIVRARIAGMLREWLQNVGSVSEPLSWARCEATLASEPLVSIACAYTLSASRGAGEAYYGAVHYRIDGDRVEPFELGAELVGIDPTRMAVDDCVGRTPAPEHWEDGLEAWRDQVREGVCDEPWSITLEARGARMDAGYGEHRTFRIPYAALARHIRADGPLGALAHLGPGVTIDRVEPPAPSEAPPFPERWSVSATTHLDELVARWLELAPEHRARVELARLAAGSGAARLVISGEDRESAVSIAAVLGASAERIRVSRDPPLPITFARATEDVHMRTAPLRWEEAAVVAVLPRGTRFAVITGTIESYDSVIGRVGRYARIVASGSAGGWVASRYVRADEGCLADASAFLARVPEGDRVEASTRVLRATVPMRRAGRSADALLFATSTARETFVAIFETADGCASGALIQAARTPGGWLRIALPGTTRNGGDSLLALATSDDGAEHTLVFGARSEREPIWTGPPDASLEFVEYAVTRGARYCPIAIGDACFVWQGGGLSAAP